ncbi:MAG: hypothetical protein ACTH7L_13830 [Psychrobacter alimentarius]
MTCHDCPNQTDGKCCHQLIRPQGSKTMNVLDEEAFVREMNHKQMMQEKRNKHVVNSLLKTMVDRGVIKRPKKRVSQ